VSPRVGSLEVESPPLCSTPSTVSSHSSTEFLSVSYPSSMSAVSKSSSLPSTISNVNKRLVLDDVEGGPVLKFVSSKKVSPLFSDFWSDRRTENSLYRSPGVG
jgi:hypothetical protein